MKSIRIVGAVADALILQLCFVPCSVSWSRQRSLCKRAHPM